MTSQPPTRTQILTNLRTLISRSQPIIGAGAGTGISAKSLEAGAIDLLVIYNSGRFRMAGHGSLAGLMPYGDANQIVVDMAREVLPVVDRTKTPVLAGICATDPFRLMPEFLRQIRDMGFVGVQNFPTVGLVDGLFRANLEETGMGYGKEVEMIRVAKQMGMLTTPYAFNREEARMMAEVGADVIVAHMGLTTKGSIGAKTTGKTLEECVAAVQEIADAAREVKEDVIVLCHGGPIAEPDDAEYLLKRTKGVHGFYGASSMERLPVEVAIKERTEEFKNLKLAG
ncbi:putative tim-barrel enzyme family protein [Phaeomoniella chlamydospora]|uniref:Putative tim-barrel enzyme family protein n=1 Tax=Phaeomoniella chlamydospora TaxID=158046 RepID=A0A0G2GSH2_PHACM|nr:putative tim-barrel enzyme family protein [Phaeomoniella chlamydospora]